MASNPPQNLKSINSFLKLAKEYDKRDPTVAYFCRMYAVQKGIQLDSKSPESKAFLFGLMDQLEPEKKALLEKGDEAVSNDLVAQAHIETQTIELFSSADTDDRNSVFNKKVTKAFYTASLLFEVLTQFGEQSEECDIMQKYSKWKATYLHRCSQTGETPVPGPTGSGFEDDLGALVSSMSMLSNLPESSTQATLPDVPPSNYHEISDTPPILQPQNPPQHFEQHDTFSPPMQQVTPVVPTPQLDIQKLDVEQVQKLLKFTMSALEYEDISTAAGNLTQALNLLTGN